MPSFPAPTIHRRASDAPGLNGRWVPANEDHAGPPADPAPQHPGRPPVVLRWLAGLLVLMIVAIAALIYFWDWNWFRQPLANVISARLHRPVSITGDLEVRPWSFEPQASVNGLVIGNPAWAGREPMATLPRLTVQVRLMPLVFMRRVELPLVAAERPRVHLIRDAQDRANWTFSGDPNRRAEPFRMPPIQHFIINDGALRVNDARTQVVFNGTVTSNERATGANRGMFALRGQGTLNRQPFFASLSGDPLLNVSQNRPYPFRAEVRAGATRITARGSILRPFDFGRFTTSLAISGPDASALYHLTGLAIPNTPPYQVSGQLERDGQRYDYRRFSGRVGDSDLSGNLSVDTRPRRPMLRADLASRHLDFDDLGAIFGGAPNTGRGETASPEQVAMASRLRAQNRLFPDARLDTTRLSAMNADVRYRADTVSGSPMPVRAMRVHVLLNDRLLRAEDLQLTLPQGQIAGRIQLDGRRATPTTEADLRLTNARVEHFLPANLRPNLQGGLYARAHLTGSGDSVRQALSSADGQFSIVMPRGRIREAFAELLGINLTRGGFLLLTHDNSQSDIRCAVASFQARGGVMTANNIVIDTDQVIARGRGSIDMRNERLDLRLEGRAKSFRLVRLMAPITLRGPFNNLRPGVELNRAAPQGVLAAVLGLAISPLAAILPFVDPGLARDANCSSLVANAGAGAAGVRTAR